MSTIAPERNPHQDMTHLLRAVAETRLDGTSPNTTPSPQPSSPSADATQARRKANQTQHEKLTSYVGLLEVTHVGPTKGEPRGLSSRPCTPPSPPAASGKQPCDVETLTANAWGLAQWDPWSDSDDEEAPLATGPSCSESSVADHAGEETGLAPPATLTPVSAPAASQVPPLSAFTPWCQKSGPTDAKLRPESRLYEAVVNGDVATTSQVVAQVGRSKKMRRRATMFLHLVDNPPVRERLKEILGSAELREPVRQATLKDVCAFDVPAAIAPMFAREPALREARQGTLLTAGHASAMVCGLRARASVGVLKAMRRHGATLDLGERDAQQALRGYARARPRDAYAFFDDPVEISDDVEWLNQVRYAPVSYLTDHLEALCSKALAGCQAVVGLRTLQHRSQVPVATFVNVATAQAAAIEDLEQRAKAQAQVDRYCKQDLVLPSHAQNDSGEVFCGWNLSAVPGGLAACGDTVRLGQSDAFGKDAPYPVALDLGSGLVRVWDPADRPGRQPIRSHAWLWMDLGDRVSQERDAWFIMRCPLDHLPPLVHKARHQAQTLFRNPPPTFTAAQAADVTQQVVEAIASGADPVSITLLKRMITTALVQRGEHSSLVPRTAYDAATQNLAAPQNFGDHDATPCL